MASKTDPFELAVSKHLKDISQAQLDGLASAANTQVMVHVLLQHEARRIQLKLGASHPRATQLQARAQAAGTQVNALRVERELLSIRVPQVPDGGALIHGRVVDEDGRGISGMTVSLIDHKAIPIHVIEQPTTDESGYFAFVLDTKSISGLRKQHETGVFLAVFTAKGSLIQRRSKPLVLGKGTILVNEIELSRSRSFEPPPPEPDRVIVPDVDRQNYDSSGLPKTP